LAPKPRVHLTRFHGVFAPNSGYRARVTPARRGRGAREECADEQQAPASEKVLCIAFKREQDVCVSPIDNASTMIESDRLILSSLPGKVETAAA
jgi:hypothetical protein